MKIKFPSNVNSKILSLFNINEIPELHNSGIQVPLMITSYFIERVIWIFAQSSLQTIVTCLSFWLSFW